MVAELILEIECHCCHQRFGLCRSCYRGQCYCCKRCRQIAQRKRHRLAQQRYRQTKKGRKAHREAENRRRQKKNSRNKKNMDDEASTAGNPRAILSVQQLNMVNRCWCCGIFGILVKEFPRRGYAGRPVSHPTPMKVAACRRDYD